MLEAFVGPRPLPDWDACHRDDDKRNNQLSNLYWGSQSDNTNDMVRNGLHNNARKVRCKYGHEFTPENTYIYRGRRNCRACKTRRREEVNA